MSGSLNLAGIAFCIFMAAVVVGLPWITERIERRGDRGSKP